MDCTCCRCGKVFDYEKYYGICPKCAAYNRQPGTEQDSFDVDGDFSAKFEVEDDSCEKLHKQYDSASAHQPHEQHMEYHRTYDIKPVSQQPCTNVKPKKGAGKGIVIFILICAILVLAICIYMAYRVKINQKLGIGARDASPVIEEVSLIDHDDITISVEEVLILEESTNFSFVPPFEKLIAVHIDVTSNGSEDAGKFRAPLVACDGIYRKNLSEYDVEHQVLGAINGVEITEEEVLSEYSYMYASDNGYFFYLVPADAASVTVVFTETEDEDSDTVVKQYWIQPSIREIAKNEGTEHIQEGV